jgi:hypothetical protein
VQLAPTLIIFYIDYVGLHRLQLYTVYTRPGAAGRASVLDRGCLSFGAGIAL